MRPSSRKKSTSASTLKAIDHRLSRAGVARSPRPTKSRPTRNIRPALRFARTTLEELTAPPPVPRRAANGVEWLPIPGWDLPWLWAGFSTRKGGFSRAYSAADAPGDLNLGFTAAPDREIDRETVHRNRRLLAEAITSNVATPLIVLGQFHSNRIVHAVRADASRKHPRKADGQMTAESGLLLAIQTADCIPVLVADRKRRAVAAFHAGWRGTLKRIVESGVGRMRLAFGSRPQDLIAAIGPGIGLCCYAVGEEVLSEFESQFSYAHDLFREVYDADPVRRKYPMLFLTQRAPGHSPIGPSLHVDLVEANRRQLLSAGLAPQSIQIVGGCTECHTDLFFSHRASHGHAGRMMAVIGIRAGAGSRDL
ncbi:MAG: peptidoglycan editing factor PgeF [Terracidiphilus sp.]|jgi:YfiH family protein